MSLYNMLFGINDLTPFLLGVLGIEQNNIPRFRDCFLSDGYIVIHTRTGGGNREYYDYPNDENQEGPWNSTLRDNEYYISDNDDEFDCTYANFYFRFPNEYQSDLEALEAGNESYTPSDKWQMLFEELRND